MIENIIIAAMAIVFLYFLIFQKWKTLFWIMIFSMVVGPRRIWVSLGGMNLNFIPFTVLLTTLCFFTAGYLSKGISRIEAICMVLLLWSILLGLINGVKIEEAILWVIPIISVFLTKHLCMRFIRTPADVDKAGKIFVIIAAVISFFTVLSAAGLSFGRFLLASGEYRDTSTEVMLATGFWGDNTVLGACSISLLFIFNKKMPLWQKVLLAALTGLAVLKSGKRMAVVALVEVVFFIVFGLTPREKKYKFGKNLMLVFLFGIFIALFFPSGMIKRFERAKMAISGEKEERRVGLMHYGQEQFWKSPIIGNGAYTTNFIHNGWLEMLADMGLTALPIFIIWLWLPITRWKSGQMSKLWAQSLAVFLMTSFTLEAAIDRPEHMAFFGFFYGMLHASLKIERSITFQANENIKRRNETINITPQL
jgi:hypothetical protein